MNLKERTHLSNSLLASCKNFFAFSFFFFSLEAVGNASVSESAFNTVQHQNVKAEARTLHLLSNCSHNPSIPYPGRLISAVLNGDTKRKNEHTRRRCSSLTVVTWGCRPLDHQAVHLRCFFAGVELSVFFEVLSAMDWPFR